jgi:hypothetical protein
MLLAKPKLVIGSDVMNIPTYVIDYHHGRIALGDLPIGARVVDHSWEWEFRTGFDYNREIGDETKPVTWIVVAKNHYSKLEPHVTLLSEELIGKHVFDNRTNQRNLQPKNGYNYWGKFNAVKSDNNLRAWLNSTKGSRHLPLRNKASSGFYHAFSVNFIEALLTTTLPNKEWKTGNEYSTNDKVFIPSAAELGDINHISTYPIGSAYAYFITAENEKRVALLDGKPETYWVRSPDSSDVSLVRSVNSSGNFHSDFRGAALKFCGVRPALNLKREVRVSKITIESLEVEGGIYNGEVKAGMPHGTGVLTWPDGKTKTGLWKNGEYVESIQNKRYKRSIDWNTIIESKITSMVFNSWAIAGIACFSGYFLFDGEYFLYFGIAGVVILLNFEKSLAATLVYSVIFAILTLILFTMF